VNTPASEQEYVSSCSGYAGPTLTDEDEKQAIALAREVCEMAGEACDNLTADDALSIIAAAAFVPRNYDTTPTGVQELSAAAAPGLFVGVLLQLKERRGPLDWLALAAALGGSVDRVVTRALQRADQWRAYWGRASLDETISRLIPEGAQVRMEGTKDIYFSASSKYQITYDRVANYFRIEDTTINGAHRYVTQYGTEIKESLLDLASGRRTIQLSEFNEGVVDRLRNGLTHFIATDRLPN
jgi:hypothetical protein